MFGIFTYIKAAGLAAVLVCGLSASTDTDRSHSQASVRDAQQQLKNDGYYNGPVDGIDGRMTHRAVRKYQSDQSLTVNGRLDHQTLRKLNVTEQGEANRSMPESHAAAQNNAASENNAIPAPTSATISAAQRSMLKKGFYKGNIDGNMGPETHAAVREYQKNSNLNVTGRLDQATLSSLGVSK